MKQEEKISTKQCPRCGNTFLLTFTSLNLKVCTDCVDENNKHIRIPWYLEEGQKSVL